MDSKTREQFFASILDDDTERERCNRFLGSKDEGVAWKTFKLVAAYKRGNSHQRKFFGTALTDEKELEMWKRFLQSKSHRVAGEAARLAKRYKILDLVT
jgi:threonyl-tRNA synthetase